MPHSHTQFLSSQQQRSSLELLQAGLCLPLQQQVLWSACHPINSEGNSKHWRWTRHNHPTHHIVTSPVYCTVPQPTIHKASLLQTWSNLQ